MSSKTRFINPDALSRPPGYTHVVEATAPARLVYLAGQIGLDRDGKVVGGAGDFRAQAVQTFENLKAGLAAVGGSFQDVVKLNNYLTDIKHLPIFREGALLEIEAVAVLPAAARAKAAGKRRGGRAATKASRSKRKR